MGTIGIGVIGCGGIAGHHLSVLKGDALSGSDIALTAFCDVNRETADKRKAEFGREDSLATSDYLELLDSGRVDAVLIATPHPFHAEAAVAAFEHGIHVLLEKPVAISVGQARRINAAHRRSSCVYTVHCQNRHTPRYRWVKERIDAGILGPLHKANIVWTNWFRPQAYYDSGTWRGSWLGEGGGVMMNQCPHDLDLFCWYLGLPRIVDARMWLGRTHTIEVEDEILALLTFESGGLAVINASTCDYPGAGRWDLVGEDGAITIDADSVKAFRRQEPLSTYNRTTRNLWTHPPLEPVAAPLPEMKRTGTESIWTNFLAAVRGKEPLFMDGEEGAMSVELANAILASGYLGKPVTLPLDEALYDGVLADLRAGKSGAALSPQKRKST
jgi:predicted dehydrogenase